MLRIFRWRAVSCAFCLSLIVSTGCHTKMTVPMQSYPPMLKSSDSVGGSDSTPKGHKNSQTDKINVGDPLQYSLSEYISDKLTYDTATTKSGLDLDLAKQKRNEMVYGLMADIELKYAHDFRWTFGSKNGIAVLGDFVTLGTTATGAIATNAATKTIMAALGTGVTGLALSVEKNYYADQSFQVLGVAMQTVRKKEKKKIIANLQKSVTDYPFNAAKEELQSLVLDGSVPRALAELQKEATAANAEEQKDAATKLPDAATALFVRAGVGMNALVWTPVSGAKSYNIYASDTNGVSTKSTKINNVSRPFYTDPVAPGHPRFYNVTAVNDVGESAMSVEQSGIAIAQPTAPSGGGAIAAPSAPTKVEVEVISGGVIVFWTAPDSSSTFDVISDVTTPVVATAGNNVAPGIGANVIFDQSVRVKDTYYGVVAHNSTAASAVATSDKVPPSSAATQ